MKRLLLIGALIAVILSGAVVAWRLMQHDSAPKSLTLYGDVDLRQVQLSFNNSERIAAVLVQEGDRVKQGQLLARLDTARLEPQLAQAEAQAAAQLQVLKRLRSGSRPEEIAQARANLQAAQADLANARQQYDRWRSAAEFSAGRAVRQQDVDNARTSVQVAEAKLAVVQKTLDLAIAGPRREEIDENERGYGLLRRWPTCYGSN